jgi:hypothetical protein
VIVQKIPNQTACFFRHAPLFPNSVHYFQTKETNFLQCPLFSDSVHYFATCSTFSQQKGSIFTYTCLTHLRSQPSKLFHFLCGHPALPSPLGAPPGCLPADPAGQPTLPQLRMVHYFPTKGSLFPDIVHYFLTKGLLFSYIVHYFPTNSSLLPDILHYFPTWYTIS